MKILLFISYVSFISTGIPLVFVPKVKYSVVNGSSVSLDCQVNVGIPAETNVQWIKIIEKEKLEIINVGGNPKKYAGATENKPSLTILNADDSNEGYYICQALNAVGKGQSSIVRLEVMSGNYSQI